MKLDGMGDGVIGVIILGGEGCSEVKEESWVRDSTDAERKLLHAYISKMLENKALAQNKIPLMSNIKKYIQDMYVDGSGRAYWCKTVFEGAPSIPAEKARLYVRTIRLFY